MSLMDRTVLQRGGQVRVGDAEREAAVAALGEHYVAGRITAEEHDDRITRAFRARVAADLWPLFSDLPQVAPPSPERRSSGRGGPRFAPLLLVVVGLVVLTNLPWPVLLVVGWLWWGRIFRRWSRDSGGARLSGPVAVPVGYRMGSRRSVRGTWA